MDYGEREKTEEVHMFACSPDTRKLIGPYTLRIFRVDDLEAGTTTLGTAVIRVASLRGGSGVVSGVSDFELLFLLTPEPCGYFPGGFSLKRSVGVQL